MRKDRKPIYGKIDMPCFSQTCKKRNKLPERSRISLENYVFVLGSFSQQLLPAVEGREKRCRKHRRKREQNFISEESPHVERVYDFFKAELKNYEQRYVHAFIEQQAI